MTEPTTGSVQERLAAAEATLDALRAVLYGHKPATRTDLVTILEHGTATARRPERPDSGLRHVEVRRAVDELTHYLTGGPCLPHAEAVALVGRYYDSIVRDADPVDPRRPRLVVICGSTRYMQEIGEAVIRLTAGADGPEPAAVFAPVIDLKTPHPLWPTPADVEELVPRLDYLHRSMIRMADEVLVVNPGGLIGKSTGEEIEYAESLGKPVRYTHPVAGRGGQEPCAGSGALRRDRADTIVRAVPR